MHVRLDVQIDAGTVPLADMFDGEMGCVGVRGDKTSSNCLLINGVRLGSFDTESSNDDDSVPSRACRAAQKRLVDVSSTFTETGSAQ